jgi:hypothetical protein
MPAEYLNRHRPHRSLDQQTPNRPWFRCRSELLVAPADELGTID